MGECFFRYWPTRVVPDKRPLNVCVYCWHCHVCLNHGNAFMMCSIEAEIEHSIDVKNVLRSLFVMFLALKKNFEVFFNHKMNISTNIKVVC